MAMGGGGREDATSFARRRGNASTSSLFTCFVCVCHTCHRPIPCVTHMMAHTNITHARRRGNATTSSLFTCFCVCMCVCVFACVYIRLKRVCVCVCLCVTAKTWVLGNPAPPRERQHFIPVYMFCVCVCERLHVCV